MTGTKTSDQVVLAYGKVSLVVQLTDPSEYEGGDLQIWAGGQNIWDC